MLEATLALLAEWENFYVIAGTAAATLTGLMFVAITLIARDESEEQRSGDALGAFATPTIVHFACALTIALIHSAPWPDIAYVGVLMGLLGLGGVIYTIIVTIRARRQSDYIPVLEDWIWHIILPLITYLALLIGGLLLVNSAAALFIIAAVSALLLFIGIHNAWDDVIYLVLEYRRPKNKERNPALEPRKPANQKQD